MTPYAEVLLASHDGRRLYCEHVAILAAHELEIPTPVVRFFRHQRAPDGFPLEAWSDERRLAGETRGWEPGEIWVWADQPRDALAATVRHECHHLAYFSRFGHGYFTPRELAVMETAAEDFALRFTQRRTQKE